MMWRMFPVILLVAMLPALADAQEKPRVQTPQAQPARAPERTPEPSTRRSSRRELNVQVELTITDYFATGAPDKKVVSVTTADGTMGRIRTGAGDTLLNIDATPSILASDRIMLNLTVVYSPPSPPAPSSVGPSPRPATVNEMLSVILQDGKSMMVSQAADPTTARRLTVEVKASILK